MLDEPIREKNSVLQHFKWKNHKYVTVCACMCVCTRVCACACDGELKNRWFSFNIPFKYNNLFRNK